MSFENIPAIRGMYVALRDGTTTVEDLFDPRKMTGRGFETVVNPLSDGEDQTAGMGEDGTATAAAGEAKPQQATQAAKPAEAAQAKPAEAAAATLPLEEKPPAKAEPKAPANAAEYVAHWRAFCAAATSAAQVKNQYAAERQLRKNCAPFDEEHYDAVNKIRDDRMEELKK